MASQRFIVTGRVQGVGFRAATRARALELGLAGSAVNLPDGSVAVEAAGSPEALDALHRWLRHGPPLARVAEVRRLPGGTEDAAGFAIG